eukprot:7549216-Alexandrium_andersonii.AAC.1
MSTASPSMPHSLRARGSSSRNVRSAVHQFELAIASSCLGEGGGCWLGERVRNQFRQLWGEHELRS